MINKLIHEDCRLAKRSIDVAHQRANAVKSGVNGLLDVSRNVRETILEQVNEYVQNISVENGAVVDYRYDKSRGFFLRIKCTAFDNPDFINIIKKRMALSVQPLIC